ncbi:hypothetical protein GUITHDRAFT_67704 [Guillardia theta CCMP2712]|uniref:non-specific serine/threonine protein kinase n=1 Tax=Guillardia theta (strain CCMP2712) TaxID=905079 RepID=L1JMU6_GUITC|nr:hypothetical protein GUITHDRAFT_67704 [Guillardia theta CCMP2712]EKX49520.1 hypothetical protein GUITHDRAFT_67704 [Guillardia theta CCMP2712]|eukprot:XP_005836500.1 hypothetical protein GUITHDRAFT_67704 [Guillardia theta CCMP2712]
MEGGIVADRYEAIKRIGHGSYGSVYLARRRGTTSSFVVLKRVFVVEEGSKEHKEAINEVKMLQRLRHRNIVAYKDSFIRDSHLCIVMAFCSGGDLHSQIRAARSSSRTFTMEQVLEWLAQILEALRYLHEEKRILHRDLKSQNVFIVPERQMALGDFGISKSLSSTEDMASTVIGTPYYMSPELCQNQPYNHKSDMWAVGCLLYEVVMLRHAFEAKNLNELVLNIMQGKFPPVNEDEWGKDISKLVEDLLQQDPAKRPSVSEVLQRKFLQEVEERSREKSVLTTRSQGFRLLHP